ncbi:MAG TPA: hypothetical protein DIW37_06750 [Chryseobacterium sp.]|nr:hypothetical protein [Chryseobacterium sp.]
MLKAVFHNVFKFYFFKQIILRSLFEKTKLPFFFLFSQLYFNEYKIECIHENGIGKIFPMPFFEFNMKKNTFLL